MELLIKRIIVLMTALSIAVPSVLMTMSFYNGTQYEKQPLNFVPSDSSFVSSIKSSTGNYYIYLENNSIGIITTLSVFLIPQLAETPSLSGSVTKNITLQYYEEYRGVSIFQIDGIDAWSLYREYAGNATYMSIFVNQNALQTQLTNVTLYVASPQNTFSVIGSIPLLERSIDSYIGHSSILTVKHIELDTESNVSLYYFPPQDSSIEHVSMNITSNYSEAYVAYTSLNSSLLLSLTSLADQYDLQLQIGQNYIEVISGSGLDSVMELLSSPAPLSTILQQLQFS